MPISVNHLRNDKRTITGHYFSDEFTVTYRPSELTPAVEAKLREATKTDDESALVALLCKMIVAWDVVDENNEPLPIEKAVLDTLPSALLGAIVDACQEDMRPKSKSSRR